MTRCRGIHSDASLDRDVASLEAIGRELGVSRERARQLIEQALARARAICEERGIDPEMFWDALERGHHRCRVDAEPFGFDRAPRGPRAPSERPRAGP